MEDMAPERLRPGCFTDKGDAGPCPHCGYAEEAARAPLLLPHRTLLNDQFLICEGAGDEPVEVGAAFLAEPFEG
jgi:hypothetical protein